jgi:hypothetical protein
MSSTHKVLSVYLTSCRGHRKNKTKASTVPAPYLQGARSLKQQWMPETRYTKPCVHYVFFIYTAMTKINL